MKTSKKVLSVLLAVLMTALTLSCLSVCVAAVSGTDDNISWNYNESTKVLNISGSGEMKDYSLVDAPWIAYNQYIKTVKINSGITSIGIDAFGYCTALTNVTIPDSVTSIGEDAFRFCTSLMNVTIPSSVTSIGLGAFSNCRSLTSVMIPDSVTSIRSHAFYRCSSATSVTIGNSVTTIGGRAFEGCTGLTSVTIPDSVTDIGYAAFECCSNLTSYSVDKNNLYYASDSYGCLYNKSKTRLIQYPIGNGRTSFAIPDSVTTIGTPSFRGCSSLTSVTIGNSVTTIAERAFEGCTGLTSVTIPDSVSRIYEYAFSSCSSLTSFSVDKNNSNYASDSSGCLYNKSETTLVQYPIGNSRSSFAIPDSVTRICRGAFCDCTSLKTLTFNGIPRNIEIDAFSNCSVVDLTILSGEDVPTNLLNQFNLKNLTIGTTRVGYFETDEYGQTTLKGLPELQHLTFLDTVEDINSSAFSDCPKLETVQFGNSRTSFGSGSFNNCKKLKKLIAPTDAINANMSFNNCGNYMLYCKNSMQPYSFHGAANYRYVPDDARFVSVKIVGSPSEWGTVRGGEYTGGPVQLYTNYQDDYCVSGYSRITVKATPKTGYFFKGWYSYKNLGRVSRDTEYTFVANEDTSLFARFEDSDFYTVTAVADPSEGGTITGAGNYEDGGTVTLTATPNICWKFLGWWGIRGHSSTKVSSDPSYTFTCTGNTTYTAKFEYSTERYRLTLDSNDGGCPSWWGTKTYALNEEVTITAEPDDGYRFVGWVKNNSLFSSKETLTLQLTEDVSLYAKFEKIPIYSVQTTVSPTAGGTVSGGGSFLENTKATVSAQEKPGYDFVGWFKNDSKVSFSHNYTFTVTGNVNLTAKFRTLENYTVTLNISPANGGTTTTIFLTVGITATAFGGLLRSFPSMWAKTQP